MVQVQILWTCLMLEIQLKVTYSILVRAMECKTKETNCWYGGTGFPTSHIFMNKHAKSDQYLICIQGLKSTILNYFPSLKWLFVFVD